MKDKTDNQIIMLALIEILGHYPPTLDINVLRSNLVERANRKIYKRKLNNKK